MCQGQTFHSRIILNFTNLTFMSNAQLHRQPLYQQVLITIHTKRLIILFLKIIYLFQIKFKVIKYFPVNIFTKKSVAHVT